MIGVGVGVGVSRRRGSVDLEAAIRAALFGGAEVGAWYDYPDSSTIYQDSVGTTAPAAGQVMGLVLDKSQGLVLGSELVTNGVLDTSAGWTISNAATVLFSDGVVRFNTTASYENFYQSYAYTVGKTYEVRFDVVARVSSAVEFRSSASVSRNINASAVGGYVFRFQAVSGDNVIRFGNANAASDITVDNISIKELPGHHAIQATTGNKPLWQTTYAEFDAFDDYMTAAAGGGGTTGFLFAAAIRPSGTGTDRTIWSDTGTNTGYKVTLDTSDRLVLSAGNGTAYTSAVRTGALTDGTDYVVMAWHDGTNLNVSVNNGAATQQAFATATAGTAGFTIGRDNGAATGPFGAFIYGAIYRKNDTSSAADRTNIATYLAGKGGVTL